MSLSLVIEKPSVCKTLAFKAPARALDWADLFGKEVSDDSKKVFSKSSSLLSLVEMPKKISKLEGSVNSLTEAEGISDGVEKIIDVFKRFMAIMAIFFAWVKISLAEGFIFLSERQLNILCGSCFLSSVVLVLHSSKEVKKNLNILYHPEGDIGLHLLKTVSHICSLTTGIFGMTATAFGEAMVAKWAILGISTVSLSTSIFKYYYNNLV